MEAIFNVTAVEGNVWRVHCAKCGAFIAETNCGTIGIEPHKCDTERKPQPTEPQVKP